MTWEKAWFMAGTFMVIVNPLVVLWMFALTDVVTWRIVVASILTAVVGVLIVHAARDVIISNERREQMLLNAVDREMRGGS